MGLMVEVGKLAARALVEEAKYFAAEKGLPSISDILLNKKDINEIIEKNKYDEFLIIKRTKIEDKRFLNLRNNKYNFYVYDINNHLKMKLILNNSNSYLISVFDSSNKKLGIVEKSNVERNNIHPKEQGLIFHTQNDKNYYLDSYIVQSRTDCCIYNYRDGLKAKYGYSNVSIKKDNELISKIYFAREDKKNINRDQFIMGYYNNDNYSDVLYCMIFVTTILLENKYKNFQYKKRKRR